MSVTRMFGRDRTPSRKRTEPVPCLVCYGRQQVVFDSDSIAEVLAGAGVDVVAVIGEAFIRCPACEGGRR